jgi:hypothetical protein
VLTPDQGTELERLRAELAQVKAKLDRICKARATNLRISEKGGISVYGLARYPITLYANQWETLLAQTDQILHFIEVNRARLASKDGES